MADALISCEFPSCLLTKADRHTHTSLWRAVTSAGRWVTRIPGERPGHPIKHKKKKKKHRLQISSQIIIFRAAAASVSLLTHREPQPERHTQGECFKYFTCCFLTWICDLITTQMVLKYFFIKEKGRFFLVVTAVYNGFRIHL